MSIAVTGAYGQLGGELCRQLGPAAIPLDIDTLDLTDGAAMVERMLAIGPEAVINCAAYTAVDKAESEPEKCRAVNAVAVEHLARRVRQARLPLAANQHRLRVRRRVAGPAAVARRRSLPAAGRLCANETRRRAGRRQTWSST